MSLSLIHICALFRRMLSNGAGSGVLELSAGVIIFVFNAVILAVSDEVFLAAYAIEMCIRDRA